MRFLAFFLFFVAALSGMEVHLEGHLDKEKLAAIDTNQQEILLAINSSSGDLEAVWEFAKRLATSPATVTVHLGESVLGPAAMLPFVADQLQAGPFVSWGDIALGTGDKWPVNLLSNRVESLIKGERPLLKWLAQAMCDPALENPPNPALVHAKESRLVINQNQLLTLGLVAKLEVLPERKVEVIAPKDAAKTPSGKRIGYIAIDQRESAIGQPTWIYVKNALDYYKKNKPELLILKLDTPGGEVFAAQKISDALKDFDTNTGVPVIAFIDNWAISAGAMLAYSCRYIAVVPDASMGAAEPVLQGEGGQMVSASEKINSALRTDFANRAKFFDRNPDIAEAMVDKDLILVWRYGKVVRLNREEEIRYIGPDPDTVITTKGKLLTLSADALMKYGVANYLVPDTALVPLTTAETTAGKWPADKLALFHHSTFADSKDGVIDVYQMDWKTQFFVLLAHPIVASLLFLGMMLGFYSEFSTPGFGFPGAFGLTCLFLIVLSSFALDIASWIELILLVAGLIFIAIELFLLPSFGIIGIAGILFFLIGLFGLMLPGIQDFQFDFDTQTFNAAGDAFLKRLACLSTTLIVALLIMLFTARYIKPSLGLFSSFVLVGGEQTDYRSTDAPSTLPQPGATGTTLTPLRPSGKVLIAGEIYEAVTSGTFLDKDTPITVDRIEGSSLIVS
ncbi:MAG: serine protease [Chlamydiia bacterium]|nr:serine protease [Chlamydiia bacterium]